MATGTRKVRHEIELTGEQQYKSSLKNIENGQKGVKASLVALNAEYGKNDKSILGLTKRQELLTKQLDLQKQKMATIKAEYDRVAAAQGVNSERAQTLARDYDYARAATTRTEKELAALNKTTELATSKMEQFKARLKESGVSLDSVGKSIENAGQKYSQFITTTMAAGAVASSKLYMDFNDSLGMLATLPDAAAYGVQKLSDEILTASDATNTVATDLTQATYDAISSGAAVADSVNMVAGAAKAAKAGASDTGTVIKGASAAINAFGLATKDATSVYDKFLVAQDAGVLTVNDIASNIGQVTGLAGPLKVSLDDVLASVSSLTLIGVPVSQAFTQIKAIMTAVLKPSSEASKEAKRLGLEFDSTAIKAKGFGGFIADVQAKTGGSEDALAKLFGQVEGLSAVMALGTTAAGSYNSILKKLGSSAGTLDAKFASRMATDTQRLTNELNKLRNNAIRIGATLSPVFSAISQGIGQVSDHLAGMSDEQRKQLVMIGLMVAAIGPTLIGIGKLITAITQIKTAMSAFSALVGGGGTLTLIIAGVAALTAGVIALQSHIDSMRPENKLKAAFGKMTVNTQAIDDAIKNAESVTYNLQLTADAKIKLTNDSEELNGEIVQWLTDGKAETAAQKKEYKAKAAEVVQPVYDAIQEAFDEKKKALDEQLAGGIIDKDTYDKRLTELKSTTDKTKESLDAEAQAYISYVLTLAAQGTKPTQEQLDKLEALRQKIVEVGDSILEAQNVALQAAKASYTVVTGGGGTKEDVVKGVAYIQTDVQVKKASLDTAHQQAMADLQTEWDQAETPELKTKIQADMDLENKNYEANVEKLQQEYSQMLSAMVDGMAKKYPGAQMNLLGLRAWQSMREKIAEALYNVDSAPTTAERIKASQAVVKMFNSLFPDETTSDPDVAGVGLTNLSDHLSEKVKEAMTNLDTSGIFEDFSTALSAGAATGLDLTSVGSTLSGLITAFDLRPDGKTLMEGLMTGGVQGITDSQGNLNQALIDAALEGNESFKATQDMHSPSRVWQGFGTNMMTGLADGISLGKIRVKLQLLLLGLSMKQAGKDSIQGLIDGAEDKRDALIAKYKSLARAALLAAKRELDEKSPSKKFAEVGRFTGEGMIQGIESTRNRVQAAMAKTVNIANVQSQALKAKPAAADTVQPAPDTTNIMNSMRGLLDGAHLHFSDRLDVRAFAMEMMGVFNAQTRALGGTP